MEIKINKDMTEYKEKYMGLSLKEAICGGLSIGGALGAYFLLRDNLPESIVTWISIVLATPPAAIGFFKYNGMSCTKFIKVLYKHYFMPNHLTYKSYNLYQSYMKWFGKLKEKEKMK